jgi:hypothetical protein
MKPDVGGDGFVGDLVVSDSDGDSVELVADAD